MQIAILCHWRSGSSLTAKILNLCGMMVGNEATGWGKVCEPQCEHARLNGVGNEIYWDISDDLVDLENRASNILLSYKEQGWKTYGVKVTHVLQDKCWKLFGPVFKRLWPDAKYVITLRHPAGVCKSLKDAEISEDAIVDSWMSTYNATNELVKKGAIVLLYPDSFMPITQNEIKLAVKKLGLNWSKKADDLLDKKILTRSAVSDAEVKAFRKKYPEAVKMFDELKKYEVGK